MSRARVSVAAGEVRHNKGQRPSSRRLRRRDHSPLHGCRAWPSTSAASTARGASCRTRPTPRRSPRRTLSSVARASAQADARARASPRDRTSAIRPSGVAPALPPTTPGVRDGPRRRSRVSDQRDPHHRKRGPGRRHQNPVDYTFGRIVGPDPELDRRPRTCEHEHGANILPIAVRRFVNPPGPTRRRRRVHARTTRRSSWTSSRPPTPPASARTRSPRSALSRLSAALRHGKPRQRPDRSRPRGRDPRPGRATEQRRRLPRVHRPRHPELRGDSGTQLYYNGVTASDEPNDAQGDGGELGHDRRLSGPAVPGRSRHPTRTTRLQR